MQNTTLVTINDDIELTQGFSLEQKNKIRKQVRFIKELYQISPLAVVAGGAPLNHANGVAARDIDIYVQTVHEAQQIFNHFQSGIVRELGNEQYSGQGHLETVLEAVVYHGKNSFLVNVMIQPRLDAYDTRLERVIGVIYEFTQPASMCYYVELYGELYIGWQYGTPFYPNQGMTPYKAKLMKKLLLLSRNDIFTHFHGMWSSQRVFHRTDVEFKNHVFRNITGSGVVARRQRRSPLFDNYGMGKARLFKRAVALAANQNEVREIYDRLNAEEQATLASQKVAFELSTAMPSVSTRLFDTTLTGSRPLSRYWVDEGTPVSQLQPSGGTDTEVAQYRITGEAAAAARRMYESVVARLR